MRKLSPDQKHRMFEGAKMFFWMLVLGGLAALMLFIFPDFNSVVTHGGY